MTLTSLVLLIMEPGPVAPQPLALQRTDRYEDAESKLFDTSAALGWQAIVIHDSGGLFGSSRTISRVHERLGRDGLGYHFVVNNGSDAEDGLIEMGFRWQRQFVGEYYLSGQGADWYNRHAIGICLIGDADRRVFTDVQKRELVWLVQHLQKQFGIPKEAVFVDFGSRDERPKRFPYAWFRRQLLSPDLP